MDKEIDFKPLMDYLDDRFSSIDSKLSEHDKRFDTLETSVDNLKLRTIATSM